MRIGDSRPNAKRSGDEDLWRNQRLCYNQGFDETVALSSNG